MQKATEKWLTKCVSNVNKLAKLFYATKLILNGRLSKCFAIQMSILIVIVVGCCCCSCSCCCTCNGGGCYFCSCCCLFLLIGLVFFGGFIWFVGFLLGLVTEVLVVVVVSTNCTSCTCCNVVVANCKYDKGIGE